MMENNDNASCGLYIHVPFCLSKCYYCDFYSEKINPEKEQKYLDLIFNEIKEIKNFISHKEIITLYIGGGTPNALSTKSLEQLINMVYSSFKLKLKEFTIEVNPGIKTDFKFLKSLGINRLSIGLQSHSNEALQSMNRPHTREEGYNFLNFAAQFFQNISVDLILGLPYQKDNDITKFIINVKDMINHISIYMLEVMPKTYLFKLQNEGLILPNTDEVVDLYNLTKTELANHGFDRYEISNFSKVGYQSQHNLIYWKGADYIGLGPSACGKIGKDRYCNSQDISNYKKTWEHLSSKDIMEEYIMLNLRLDNGINLKEFKNLFKINFIDVYQDKIKNLKKHLVINTNNVKIKSDYLLLENQILLNLLDL